jgi:hypothetical protein
MASGYLLLHAAVATLSPDRLTPLWTLTLVIAEAAVILACPHPNKNTNSLLTD